MVITGPRQSGKTMLLKHLFGRKYRYVSIEPPDVRMAAIEDPRGFIEMYSPPVIFDEVQYAPELLPYIKEKIDAERNRYGQYLITGSQNLLLVERVTESLAGRAAMLKLLPLTRREAEGHPAKKLPWEMKGHETEETKVSSKKLWKEFFRRRRTAGFSVGGEKCPEKPRIRPSPSPSPSTSRSSSSSAN